MELRLCLSFLTWINIIHLIAGDAEVYIRLIDFENMQYRNWNEACCKTEVGRARSCNGVCVLTLHACIKQDDRLSCTTTENAEILKIRTKGHLKVPYNLTLEVRGNNNIIDKLQTKIAAESWRPGEQLLLDLQSVSRSESTYIFPSRLRIAVSVICSDHYYGTGCSHQCVASDDCSGHYTCDKMTGEKRCNIGWKGRNCTEKIPGYHTCPDTNECEKDDICILNASPHSEKGSYLCCPRSSGSGRSIPNTLHKHNKRKREIRYSCPRNKCRNFGTCENGTCICKKGFEGELCQIDKTKETQNMRPHNCPPCTSNNTCGSNFHIPLSLIVNKTCPENMYGVNCDKSCIPKNSCGDGHYTCDPASGEKVCLNGWGGPDCNIRNISKECDSECPKMNCKNDGVCFNGACCCKKGLYTGKYCETEILMCDENPCQNNASCYNIQNNYACDCQNGYSGRNCETYLFTTVHVTTTSSSLPTTTATGSSTTNSEETSTSAATNPLSDTTLVSTLPIHSPTSKVAHTSISTESTSTNFDQSTSFPVSVPSIMSSTSTATALHTSSRSSTISSTEKQTLITSTSLQQTTISTSQTSEGKLGSSSTSTKLQFIHSTPQTTVPGTIEYSSSSGTKSSTVGNDVQISQSTEIHDLTPVDSTPFQTTIPKSSLTTSSFILQTTEQQTSLFHMYISGNIENKDRNKLEKLINKSIEGCGNSRDVDIVNMQHLISDNGIQVTNISYVVVGCLNVTDPNKDSNFTSEFNQLLSSTEPFQHSQLYGSNTEGLKDLSFSYYINMIGFVHSNNLRAIKELLISVWSLEKPDIPEVDILVILREYYLGDYGIYVRKLSYFVTSKGKLLSPTSIKPPISSTLQRYFNDEDSTLNHLYTGRTLTLYKNAVRMNIRDGEIDKSRLLNSLSKVWGNYLKVNSAADNKTIDFIFSKTEPCTYTERANVFSLMYIPIWSTGTQVEIASPTLPASEFSLCKCQPKRQFYVDVEGRIKLKDRPSVEEKIKKVWRTVKQGDPAKFTKVVPLRSKDGKHVTQLWFTQPATSRDNLEMWPNPDMGNKLEEIANNLAVINRNINYGRIERWHSLVLDGFVKSNRKTEIINFLLKSWKEKNTDILNTNIEIGITNWSNNYSCSLRDTVTLVQYKVTVLSSDSSENNVIVPSQALLKRIFGDAHEHILHCTPRHQREIGLLGDIGLENKTDLETTIQNTWMQANYDLKAIGLPMNITVHVTKLVAGYHSGTGEKATKIKYYIDVKTHNEDVDEDDIDEPETSKLQYEIENKFPGVTVSSLPLTESVNHIPEEKTNTWVYPLIVVACVLVLVAFVAALFAFIRYQRHRDSKTLTQDPEEVEGYDKEHFSEEPEMDNSSFSLEETYWNDQQNHKTYYVN